MIALDVLVCVRGDETIRYFGGPRIAMPLLSGPGDVDLNWDGHKDIRFESGTACTGGLSESCWNWMSLTPYIGTAVLAETSYVVALAFGSLVGNEAAEGSQWTTNSVTVAIQKQQVVGEPILQSPLQIAGEGYVGFQFTASDGSHYGWIKVRVEDLIPIQPVYSIQPNPDPVATVRPAGAALPMSNQAIFVIAGLWVYIDEWAFETRPNVPIAAGTIPTPEALAVGLGSRAGNIRVAWPALAGAAYQVQFKDSLSAPVWEVVDLRMVATGATAAAELPISGLSRFFRIVRAD